jgi:hypothetical protein
MTNPAGTRFASQLVEALRAVWPRAERRAQRGRYDAGDVAGTPWTIEAKATRAIDLSGAMDEAKAEAKNAGTDLYCAIIKRRNHSIADAYVVIPLHVWLAREAAAGLGSGTP